MQKRKCVSQHILQGLLGIDGICTQFGCSFHGNLIHKYEVIEHGVYSSKKLSIVCVHKLSIIKLEGVDQARHVVQSSLLPNFVQVTVSRIFVIFLSQYVYTCLGSSEYMPCFATISNFFIPYFHVSFFLPLKDIFVFLISTITSFVSVINTSSCSLNVFIYNIHFYC